MQIHILTLFPGMFDGPFADSMVRRAIERGMVSIQIHNIRDFTHDRHRTVDDYPYGGGTGMVLKPEPLFEAVESITGTVDGPPVPVILLSPQGRTFSHEIAAVLARQGALVLVCGHYEGVDDRVRQHLATDEISIGDYVLTGGELPAMVVTDAVVRLLPGVLGSEEGAEDDSYVDGLLEYPQYTRPQVFRGWQVPETLVSGNHGEIARWRREQALRRTLERRPDLLSKAALSPEKRETIDRIKAERDP